MQDVLLEGGLSASSPAQIPVHVSLILCSSFVSKLTRGQLIEMQSVERWLFEACGGRKPNMAFSCRFASAMAIRFCLY